MKPTDEQQDAIDAIVDAGNSGSRLVTRIVAFAGTGKTTTLREGAKANPHKRYLYLAYNKAAQVAAERSFPSNCTCQTIHSLAYRQVGKVFRDRVSTKNPKLTELVSSLGIRSRPGLPGVSIARAAAESMQVFFHQVDPHPDRSHVVTASLGKRDHAGAEEDILSAMRKWWMRMTDPVDSFPISMDALLKMYYGTGQDIGHLGYDAILLDEAQDSDPVTVGVMKAQSLPLVFVGDPYQQLYSYRGAVDAMELIPSQRTCALTGSFRFGSRIAEVANRILGGLGSTRALRGLAPDTGSIGAYDLSVVDRSRPYAYLARTNAGLIAEAIAVAEHGRRCFIGRNPWDLFTYLMSVWGLRYHHRSEVRAPSVKRFATWDEFVESSEAHGDMEALVSMRLVERYGEALPNRVQLLKSRAVDSPDQAEVVLSTAHRAKGLEWNQVVVGDDFRLPERLANPSGWAAEMNLAYVTCTRAMTALDLSASMVAATDQSPGVPPLFVPGMSLASPDSKATILPATPSNSQDAAPDDHTRSDDGSRDHTPPISLMPYPMEDLGLFSFPRIPQSHQSLQAFRLGAIAVGRATSQEPAWETMRVPRPLITAVQAMANAWFAAHGLPWPYPEVTDVATEIGCPPQEIAPAG